MEVDKQWQMQVDQLLQIDRLPNKTGERVVIPFLRFHGCILRSFLAYYFAWLFSTAVRPIWEILYTKLLNFVYGGNCPTNSSTAYR